MSCFIALRFPGAHPLTDTTTLPRTHASMKMITKETPNTVTNSTSTGAIVSPATPIDINILRERSKHLPLISALCNDRSLLKQTAFVVPKHPASNTKQHTLQSSKGKYPVSNLSTTQFTKSRSKMSIISHRHPQDKLPPLPLVQTTLSNNYVLDPAMNVHKSFSSQPNLKQA